MYGTERMALATLEGMGHYDKRVVIAPPTWNSESVVQAAQDAGYEAVVFSGRLSLIKAVVPWMLRYKSLDVIGTGVVHNALCHVLGRILRVKVRQLHVAHGGTLDSYARKSALNRFPVLTVAVSEFVRDALIRYGVCADRIIVIDNFLSAAQRRSHGRRLPYSADGIAARPMNRGRVVVAVVSRLDLIKKVAVLVEAVSLYGLSEFQFDIYGTGTEIDRLKAGSAAMPNVRIHGYASDVKDRLKAADLLLHLCPEEPFGLVVLEGFLSRLVVIVPDSGGAGALIEDGVTGLRFKADDVGDLARVLHVARSTRQEDLQRLADGGAATLDVRFSPLEGARRYRLAFESAEFS
jgi:glycosyltransferase involved in cell wall biosynthesis